MSATTLAIAGTVSLATGACFLLVGRAVSSRPATGGRLLARRAHTAWWAALGLYLVLQGLLTLLAGADMLEDGWYMATRVVLTPLVCVGAWGMTFYLVYLYTGRTSTAIPLALLYATTAAMMLYATYALPQHVTRHAWHVSVDDHLPIYRLAYAIVGLPPIGASAAYLFLLRRTRDRDQRYRIVLVAGSIFAYVASGLAARLLENDVLIFATLVGFGLVAAFASLAAYYPPGPVRAWLARGASS